MRRSRSLYIAHSRRVSRGVHWVCPELTVFTGRSDGCTPRQGLQILIGHRLARVAHIFPGGNKDPRPTKYYSSGLDVSFSSWGLGLAGCGSSDSLGVSFCNALLHCFAHVLARGHVENLGSVPRGSSVPIPFAGFIWVSFTYRLQARLSRTSCLDRKTPFL